MVNKISLVRVCSCGLRGWMEPLNGSAGIAQFPTRCALFARLVAGAAAQLVCADWIRPEPSDLDFNGSLLKARPADEIKKKDRGPTFKALYGLS